MSYPLTTLAGIARVIAMTCLTVQPIYPWSEHKMSRDLSEFIVIGNAGRLLRIDDGIRGA